jgi:hypothetical protein
MEDMQRRLGVSSNVGHDAFEDLRLIGLGTNLSIQVLQLHLLPPEVVVETVEVASFILLAFLVFERVLLNTLPNLR